jgi:hypothetical protein
LEWIKNYGLDVIGLKKYLNCSYATALIRMNEEQCKWKGAEEGLFKPFIGLLYEWPYWEESQNGEHHPRLQLKVFTKSKGFSFQLIKSEVNNLIFVDSTGRYSCPPRIKNAFARLREDALFQNVNLLYIETSLAVDVLVTTITWKRYPHNPPKVLIQIMPSEYRYLPQLAEIRGIPKRDFSWAVDQWLDEPQYQSINPPSQFTFSQING